MNAFFGRFNSSNRNDPTLFGRNALLQQYRQFMKVSDVPNPGNTWVTLDEHPDSINDGYFINGPNRNQWGDTPASNHGGGSSFSFADGHSEIKKWNHEMKSNITFSRSWSPRGAGAKADWLWHQERSSAPKNRR